MPLPTSGSISYGDIASEIEAKYSITLADKKWSTMRSACNINHFHPDYKDGATSISQIKKVSQFRGFPREIDLIQLFCEGAISSPSGVGGWVTFWCTLKKVSDDSQICQLEAHSDGVNCISGGIPLDTEAWTFTNYSHGGSPRAGVSIMGGGYSFAASPYNTKCYALFMIHAKYIYDTFGDFYANVVASTNTTIIVPLQNTTVNSYDVKYWNGYDLASSSFSNNCGVGGSTRVSFSAPNGETITSQEVTRSFTGAVAINEHFDEYF